VAILFLQELGQSLVVAFETRIVGNPLGKAAQRAAFTGFSQLKDGE
jgi:hypothetical protein